MKLKTVKRMNACVLSAAMVLSGVTIIPPATVSAAANNEINYALSATATVSDQETNYWGADKAIGGIGPTTDPISISPSSEYLLKTSLSS